jgi:hypothetical protein
MKKLDLTIPSERIIGFTIPRDGRFYVLDHNEAWEIKIGPPLEIEETDIEPNGFVAKRDDFVGWGDERNPPILVHGETAVSYEFDPRQDHVTVSYSTGESSGEIEFRTLSGDWFSASLSADGSYLVLAEPYAVELYSVR